MSDKKIKKLEMERYVRSPQYLYHLDIII